MWFYHWCGVVNELLKIFRFGLTTFVLLFTQAVFRIYSHAPSLSIWCLEEKWNNLGVIHKDSNLWWVLQKTINLHYPVTSH